MINRILKKITPSEEEKLEMGKASQKLVERVKGELDAMGLNVDVKIFGSVSRDTWLSYEKDIDVFVRFPTEFSKSELEDAVTTVGKNILKGLEKRFAEHPYVAGEFDGHSVEIVPCYKVDDVRKRISAVDRTPFHDEFVKAHIKGKQSDVRILKQFLRGIGCYGAEAKVEGFSGYLAELLVIFYGSFEKTLKAASNWKRLEAIDIKGEGNPSQFPGSNLIFIDPTDSSRNVASALSLQNFHLFIIAAKQYLKSPKESFFFPGPRVGSFGELRKKLRLRGTHLVSISFQTPRVIEDILYSQLKKAMGFIERKLSETDFAVVNSGYFVAEKTTLVFELESLNLPTSKMSLGPLVNSDNEADFLKKHKGSGRALTAPFIRGDRWSVFLKREHSDAIEFITFFLTKEDLKRWGVPSHIASAIQKGFDLQCDEEAIFDDLEFFANLFDPLFPWEAGDV
jgi:tRNA nucleotidyltransferase (CCA-adding enzyme)